MSRSPVTTYGLLVTGTATPTRASWRMPVALTALVVVTVAAVLYLAWAAWIAFWAGEGAVPPASRDPDLPAGATVVEVTEPCGSGGCWREIVVAPPDGTTPEQLVEEMGVAERRRDGWRPLDPHSVEVGSRVVDDELVVTVRY
jgi:hypothetical protein